MFNNIAKYMGVPWSYVIYLLVFKLDSARVYYPCIYLYCLFLFVTTLLFCVARCVISCTKKSNTQNSFLKRKMVLHEVTRFSATLLHEKLMSCNMARITIVSVIFVAVSCCKFLNDAQKLTAMLRELCCT